MNSSAIYLKIISLKKYIIKAKYTAAENPQATLILEGIHQVIVNLVRTFHFQNNSRDKGEPQ